MTAYVVSPDVVWTVDDEIRMYDAASGEFKKLTRTASAIWSLAADGHDADYIVARLSETFAGDPSVREDVYEFLATLLDRAYLLPGGVNERLPT